VFHVVGGVWKSTDWSELSGEMEHYGPFLSPEEAEACWRGHAQARVDDAHHRLFVVKPVIDPATSEPVFRAGNAKIEIDAAA
jgi:hypothetical protein